MIETNELDDLLEGIEANEGAVADAVLESLSADDELLAMGDTEKAGETEDPSPTLNKKAIYEAQESKIAVVDTAQPAAKKAKGKKTAPKAAKATKKAAKVTPVEPDPKEPTDNAIHSRSEALRRRADMNDLAKMLDYSPDQLTDLMREMDEAPKKVGEKCYNILRFALGREHISNYSRFAITALNSTDTGLKVPELVALMEERWKPGTARSQAQQMSRLFGILGIVNRVDGKMVLDRKHPIVKSVVARLRTSAPAA